MVAIAAGLFWDVWTHARMHTGSRRNESLQSRVLSAVEKEPAPVLARERVEAKRLCQGIKDARPPKNSSATTCSLRGRRPNFSRGRTRFFLGKYKLLKFRGRGAMGIVFKAQHPRARTALSPSRSSPIRSWATPRSVSRFLREIRSAAVLNHPNIVVAYDADQVGNTYCLVMEYVSGRSLKAIFLERGGCPCQWCCECARQTALALDHVHSRGLVHRDVKPSNLIVTRRAADNRLQVKLLDVGLARFVSEAEQDAALTRDGQIVGTGDLHGPRAGGQCPQEADIRADIFSLGATLFQLIAGKAPLAGETLLQTYMNRLQNDPPRLSILAPTSLGDSTRSWPRCSNVRRTSGTRRPPKSPPTWPPSWPTPLPNPPRGPRPGLRRPPERNFFGPPSRPTKSGRTLRPRVFRTGRFVADSLIAGAASSSGTASSSDTSGDTAVEVRQRLLKDGQRIGQQQHARLRPADQAETGPHSQDHGPRLASRQTPRRQTRPKERPQAQRRSPETGGPQKAPPAKG